MTTVRIKDGWLTFGMAHQPGDPPPSGYCDWHEWADVQHKAGLRQARCFVCGLWNFPQEFSSRVIESTAYTSSSVEVKESGRACLKCDEKLAKKE